jgi:hypothetical protein
MVDSDPSQTAVAGVKVTPSDSLNAIVYLVITEPPFYAACQLITVFVAEIVNTGAEG